VNRLSKDRFYNVLARTLRSASGDFVKNAPTRTGTSLGPHKLQKYIVQVLPVIRKPIVEETQAFGGGEILLCRWKEGNFEGRYTGLMSEFDVQVTNTMTKSAQTEILCHKLRACARKTFSDVFPEIPTDLKLVGAIRFDGPPGYDEYIYLGEVQPEMKDVRKMLDRNGSECTWFNWNEIPYDSMPADDRIWYPLVLSGSKVKGSFKFGGVEEKSIKSFKLQTYTDDEKGEDGLIFDGPLPLC
jgi:hypothetical protein